jgi:HK97 gp10 family phage protein
MGIQIKGLDNFMKTLDKVGDKEAILKGLEKSALRVEASAKENAPVDTGRLRASITHKMDNANLSASVGSNLEYASAIEFGTTKMSAQPYMYPSVKEHANQITKDIAEEILKAMGGK